MFKAITAGEDVRRAIFNACARVRPIYKRSAFLCPNVISRLGPNKPRGVPRVNDRRVLNGIFWILRSGAPWRDLPEVFEPYTTCYTRFVRWRTAGIWNLIMEALTEAHDGSVQMIDTSIVRVQQHSGCAGGGETRLMGRSRGGLTTKIHACVDTNGMPVRLELTTGEAHDNRLVTELLSDLKSGAMLIADTMRIGSEDSPMSAARGPTFHQNVTAKAQSALALTFTPGTQSGRAIFQQDQTMSASRHAI